MWWVFFKLATVAMLQLGGIFLGAFLQHLLLLRRNIFHFKRIFWGNIEFLILKLFWFFHRVTDF